MGLVPVNVESFSGLNLRDDPAEVGLGQAVDMLNVDLDRRGRIRQRDGYTLFATPASATRVFQIAAFATTGGSGQILVSYGTSGPSLNKVVGYDNTGTAIATQTVSGAAAFVRVGTSSAEYTYAIDATSGWYRWNGSTWTSVPGMPAAWYATVQATDNRLVAARTANVSRVQFSDAGAPETFGANNYVDLTPGDGEGISAVAAWRDQVFVFKPSRFFVFYGNGTDSTGNPVFNYRPVETTGAYGSASLVRSACAGIEGVYFYDGRSIWLTTGGPPIRISEAIDPYLLGQTLPLFASGAGVNTASLSLVNLSYSLGRLYVSLPSTSGNTTFVYDPQLGQWMLYDWPLKMACEQRLSTEAPEIVFLASDFKVYRSTSAQTTDNGTAITSRYRSGFSDLGGPGTEKTIRQTELVGQGTVSLGWSRDFGSITSTSTGNVTLGTAPATARGLHRLSQNGELLGYQVSSVSGGAWMLNRVTPMVRPFRQPGDKSA